MLGWVAAVNATESPSQLSPALIQRTWTVVSSAATASAESMRASLMGLRMEAPSRRRRPAVPVCATHHLS